MTSIYTANNVSSLLEGDILQNGMDFKEISLKN